VSSLNQATPEEMETKVARRRTRSEGEKDCFMMFEFPDEPNKSVNKSRRRNCEKKEEDFMFMDFSSMKKQ
jgi:hypothetical protein